MKLAILSLVLSIHALAQGTVAYEPLGMKRVGLFPSSGSPSGGTVTTTGSITTGVIPTFADGTSLETLCTTCTLDSSGNLSIPGELSTGVGSGVAGHWNLHQGTSSTPTANSVMVEAPTSIPTAYKLRLPTAGATGLLMGTFSGTTMATSIVDMPLRSTGQTFSGGGTALVAGTTAPTYAWCDTIKTGGTAESWDASVDTGTATFKVWYGTSATALPTVSNSINTAGVAIATGTTLDSTDFSDFTGAAAPVFAANSKVCVQLSAVSGSPTQASFKISFR